MSYSIAIRTLGTAAEALRRELESLRVQTLPPDRIVIYIAEGYSRPEFTVGDEEYVWVPKGMMAQRILPYSEITSDRILMLDDDVCLAPDCAARLMRAMDENEADCVGADVFKNHEMGLWMKMKAAATNLVFPHRSRKWAFKYRRDGSFSYNLRPESRFYWSHTCGGPVQLWNKAAFESLRFEDELWIDHLGFSFGDDALMTFKLYSNGGRLGVLYDSGVENLDAGSASVGYRNSPRRLYTRTKASFMVWWRTCYRTGVDSVCSRLLAGAAFAFKSLWLLLVMAALSAVSLSPDPLKNFVRGIRDGRKEVSNPDFAGGRPYVFFPMEKGKCR